MVLGLTSKLYMFSVLEVEDLMVWDFITAAELRFLEHMREHAWSTAPSASFSTKSGILSPSLLLA